MWSQFAHWVHRPLDHRIQLSAIPHEDYVQLPDARRILPFLKTNAPSNTDMPRPTENIFKYKNSAALQTRAGGLLQSDNFVGAA